MRDSLYVSYCYYYNHTSISIVQFLIFVHFSAKEKHAAEEEEKSNKTVHKAKVEDDEYKTEEQTYYSIAHTVHESVTEQASILVNGKLKEYQIKVNEFYICDEQSLIKQIWLT